MGRETVFRRRRRVVGHASRARSDVLSKNAGDLEQISAEGERWAVSSVFAAAAEQIAFSFVRFSRSLLR
jgi:hypothetical protein